MRSTKDFLKISTYKLLATKRQAKEAAPSKDLFLEGKWF